MSRFLLFPCSTSDASSFISGSYIPRAERLRPFPHGAAFKEIRCRLGLSQQQLADLSAWACAKYATRAGRRSPIAHIEQGRDLTTSEVQIRRDVRPIFAKIDPLLLGDFQRGDVVLLVENPTRLHAIGVVSAEPVDHTGEKWELFDASTQPVCWRYAISGQAVCERCKTPMDATVLRDINPWCRNCWAVMPRMEVAYRPELLDCHYWGTGSFLNDRQPIMLPEWPDWFTAKWREQRGRNGDLHAIGDPFTVDSQGRWVGEDGFVVPRNFDEFYAVAEFQNFIRQIVHKEFKRHAAQIREEQVEDVVQELLLHCCSLSNESKYRASGATDVVQTFCPVRQFGAGKKRFLNYMKFIITNKLYSLVKRETRNPLANKANLSVSVPGMPDEPDSEPLQLSELSVTPEAGLQERIIIAQLEDFICEVRPDVTEAWVVWRDAGGDTAGDAAVRNLYGKGKEGAMAVVALHCVFEEFREGIETPGGPTISTLAATAGSAK